MRFYPLVLIFFFVISSNMLYAEDKPVIDIGLLTELSGSNAVNGKSCQEGFDLARKIHDKAEDNLEIKYHYADSKGLPATGVTELQKLLAVNDIDVVIATRSQVGMALNPISRQKKIPLLGIVGHARFTSENPYAFRFWPTTKHEGPAISQKALKLGLKKMAIITLEDEWTLSLTEQFTKAYTSTGGRVVFDERLTEADTDLSSLITRISQSGADAIFVNLALAHSGLLIRKLRERGLSQQIFSNFWGANQDTIETAGKDAIEGLLYTSINLQKPNFLKSFEAKYNHTNINAVTYSCYTALTTVLDTLDKTPTPITVRPDLYQALLKAKTISTLDGTISLSNREAEFDLIFNAIHGGKSVLIQ